MQELKKPFCPDCESDRREFMVAGAAGILAVGSLGVKAPALLAAEQAPPAPANKRPARPAEALIRDLFDGMTAEQKRNLVLPWNDAKRRSLNPNRALNNQRIGDNYTQAQQELIERIVRAISSGEEGYRKITRAGTWDASRSLQGCGAHIFGEPGENRQFAFLFTGHHLTVRCDGNSEPNAAFGGPMYYGHSPDGHSVRNVFNYQTRSVQSVFDALNENQRRQAIVTGSPGEDEPSIRFRAAGQAHPGVSGRDLSADQRRLVETVMRTILDPYRREDADEVMQIVQKNGGMERIHLAFYRDREANDTNRWHFWRLEGPGFVWNFRILPHVHTFVNIAAV